MIRQVFDEVLLIRALLNERRRSESNRRIEVLQTSALPLGYGAETRKLAIYMEFLNPPRERFQTPASQTSASQFGHAAATEIDSHRPIAFLNSPASVPATVGIFVGTHDSPRPAPSCGSRTL